VPCAIIQAPGQSRLSGTGTGSCGSRAMFLFPAGAVSGMGRIRVNRWSSSSFTGW
jgi:hypothetical protein